MTLTQRLDAPRRPITMTRRLALFDLGFRPFYLAAALFAALAVPAWLLALTGHLSTPTPGLWWHAHEMLFGFVGAVIVGFLFTAGRNWTGLPTPTGLPLALLVLMWLAGRLGMALDGGAWAAGLDLPFLPAAAVALARVLRREGNRRNYFVVVLLGLLSLANLAFHLARLQWFDFDPLAALHLALACVVLLETAIGGRIIPSFTASAIKDVRQWQDGRFNVAAIAATALALVAWALGGASAFVAPLLIVASLLQFVRAFGWNPWASRRTPLLWILHVSHLWIPVGLALLAAAQAQWVPVSAGIHALAIGATGGLIVGMITRTALGHTGRMIVTGRIEAAAYVLVQVAAAARVLTLVVAEQRLWMAGVHFAGACWTLAFLLYFWRYLPYLLRPRVDGQPG